VATNAGGRLESVDATVMRDLARALDVARVDPGMLSEDVYRVLREAIVAGRIPVHTHLSQIPLGSALGVSRTPIRDALLRLAQDGLIRSAGGRGYVVEPLETTEVAEIYEVRRRLVEWALSLVRDRISETDLWEARRIHQEMTRPDRLEATRYYDLNRAFHRAFIRSCPNRTLLQLIDRLWELPTSQRMFVRYYADRVSVEKMIREHEAILVVAERGDHDGLARRILLHIEDAADDTTAFIARDLPAGEALAVAAVAAEHA
jgi:DNA-binding GntR family transcriptional regulator